MPFEAGHNKSTGRPKGSKGKINEKVRSLVSQLVDNNLEGMQKDLDSLTPSQRIKMQIELMKFVIPTCKSVEIEEVPTSERPSWIDELLENEIKQ